MSSIMDPTRLLHYQDMQDIRDTLMTLFPPFPSTDSSLTAFEQMVQKEPERFARMVYSFRDLLKAKGYDYGEDERAYARLSSWLAILLQPEGAKRRRWEAYEQFYK